MKTDLRVRYTRKVIQEAFQTLLQEKPLAKITVTEVCELAGINRGTFYKHYLDCYDLMEHMQNEAVASFERLLNSVDANSIRNIIASILKAMKYDAGVYLLFKSQGQSDAFMHKLIGCCYRFMEKRISDFPGLTPAGGNGEYNYSFLVSGCCGVIEHWVHFDMREPPEAVAEEILRLSEAFLRGLGQ